MSTRLTGAACLALAVAGLAGCAANPKPKAAGHAIVLPFIENDYPKALATARAANLPVFVEVWAPW
jgi:hypothetical protein